MRRLAFPLLGDGPSCREGGIVLTAPQVLEYLGRYTHVADTYLRDTQSPLDRLPDLASLSPTTT